MTMSAQPRRQNPWSDAEHRTLSILWGDGLTASAIGEQLHRSKNSVIGYAHRSGLPPRPSPILGVLLNEPERARRAAEREVRRLMRLTTLPPLLSAIEPEVRSVSVSPIHTVAAEPDVASPRYRHECCWPIGDPGRRGFRFCEAPTNGGRIYCPEHHRRGHAGRAWGQVL